MGLNYFLEKCSWPVKGLNHFLKNSSWAMKGLNYFLKKCSWAVKGSFSSWMKTYILFMCLAILVSGQSQLFLAALKLLWNSMIQRFTSYTINCVCQSIRSMFRVLGIYILCFACFPTFKKIQYFPHLFTYCIFFFFWKM